MTTTGPPWLEFILLSAGTWAAQVLIAIVLMVAGWMASIWAGGTTRRLMLRSEHIDPTVVTFVASLVRYGLLIVTVVVVLARIGVQTTSLVAVLGAAGLAIGLALQGALSDVAAGLMLLVVRPFRVGDVVQLAGLEGEVRAVALFTTEIATADNRKIVVPNSKVWGQPIQNLSFYKFRRIEIRLLVTPESATPAALEALRVVLCADPDVLPEPPPAVARDSMVDGAHLLLHAWVMQSNLAATKARLANAVDAALSTAGLAHLQHYLPANRPGA